MPSFWTEKGNTPPEQNSENVRRNVSFKLNHMLDHHGLSAQLAARGDNREYSMLADYELYDLITTILTLFLESERSRTGLFEHIRPTKKLLLSALSFAENHHHKPKFTADQESRANRIVNIAKQVVIRLNIDAE